MRKTIDERFADVMDRAAAFLEGFKTNLFALALFALGFLNMTDPRLFAAILPPMYQGWAFLLVPFIIYFLRQLTKGRSRVKGFRPRDNGTEGVE